MSQTKTERERRKIETELRQIAFASAADYLKVVEGKEGEQHVRVLPLGQLKPAQRSALAMLKDGKSGVELQLKNPFKALELLCKLYGLLGPAEEAKDNGRMESLLAGLQQLENGGDEDADDL